ncbi:MAG: lysyl oxidase family protein [Flavobacteriales bacterium]
MRSLLLPVLLMAVGAMETSAQCVTSYPMNETFNGFTAGTPGTFQNNWTNITGDDLDWWADRNGTPTEGTGPIGDHSTLSTREEYMYVSAAAAGNTPNKSAILQSPCFDLTSLTSPYLTFWYHMRGTQQGSLHVDLNVNGSIVSDVWVISGNHGLLWKQGWLDLSAYQGQTNLRIRFRGVTGTGPSSDIGLDDVFVGNLTPVIGCNESTAANYNAAVNINDNSCDYSCPAGQKRVKIDIVSDNYPSETTWTLKNGSTGVTLANGTTSGTSLCVPNNTCLVFRINDTAGDGIYHNSYGYGGYWIYLDGVLIKEGGVFGSFEETTFNCPPGFSCSTELPLTLAPVGSTYPVTLTTFTTTAVEQWYAFTPPQSGAYTISTCGTNSCDTRLWLYDMACGSIVLSSGVEGATFADDNDGGCGTQAVVSANMPGGVLHHLRVGDNAGACSGAVTVTITYNGPVVGCMNTNSCNYEPLATVACNDCCIAFGDPDCPDGPDLTLNQTSLTNSLTMQTVNITDACAPVEGCTRGLGQRRVIRFTTRIDNIGTTDYYIGNNSTYPGMFDTNNCHGHAHFAGYADYILFDQSGEAIPVGFKNGFCVIDVGCTPGHSGQFGCSNMGITAGCYDVYGSGTTCNWIDVTDVAPGTYTLVLRTNWQRAPDALGRHETDYSNNYAQVCINLTATSFSIVTDCPPFTDCLGQPYGDARMDCNGVCAGTTKRGDLNSDGNMTQPDAQEYIQRIMGEDISPTACNDLNNDGRITVTDAALLANCYNQQDYHDQNNHVLHYHPWCDFPRGYLSTTDNVELSLANLDPVAKTVDVLIRNPARRVLGYEFNMGGLTIQSVQNLAPNLVGEISMNSTLGGTKVIGMSYIDSSLVKSAVFQPLCRITYLSLTGGSVCIASIDDIVNEEANNMMTSIVGGCLAVPNTVSISPKVWLDGAYDPVTGLMRDDLRAASLIPTTEPYSALGFTQAGGGGGEQVNASVFATTGNDAIVDWVLVELRDVAAPHGILATRSALLQRDGDIVAIDGTSPVQLQLAPGNYHVAIRHRNHFGVMTGTPVGLGSASTVVDLRSSGTSTWGTGARKDMSGAMVMWAGNSNADRSLKYTGGANDRDPILVVIGGVIPTGTVAGYYLEDTNLSGLVKYTGVANDRDLILQNIGGVIPTNSLSEQIPRSFPCSAFFPPSQ